MYKKYNQSNYQLPLAPPPPELPPPPEKLLPDEYEDLPELTPLEEKFLLIKVLSLFKNENFTG